MDSAHANQFVAAEAYNNTAAAARDFPLGVQVWQAACLNCHDTHTVSGSRRLLREGTDDVPAVGEVLKPGGGNSAIEETCYQCHSDSGYSYYALSGVNPEVPDIRTDFNLAYRMPITAVDGAGNEAHDIGNSGGDGDGKDFIESQSTLGKGNLLNRHAECTDCHNPHRVIKNRLATDNPATPAAAGTHDHSGSSMHTNLISGVLRGTWGVEPIYSSTAFNILPSSYTVKRGVAPQGGSMTVTQSYVTREYQVCLKCHSDYGFDDINPPALGYYTGGTPTGTNGVTHYTNQAMEFQAPVSHQGEGSAAGTGAAPAYSNNNHRGWHPVMGPTGRTAAVRSMDASNFLAPWNDVSGTNVGNQTMYCSDCHGSDTAVGTVVPTGGEDGNPWGPHGSSNGFILKGQWSNNTGYVQMGVFGTTQNDLCFKCHNWDDYANPNNTNPGLSGFRDSTGASLVGCAHVSIDTSTRNLHTLHANIANNTEGAYYSFGSTFACTNCHAAVPHGWKNKALLVNLNDVGPEVGLPEGTVIDRYTDTNWVGDGYSNGPYYLNAKLYVVNFKQSGDWTEVDCGYQSSGGPFPMMGACDSTP